MISSLTSAGIRVPGGFATTAKAFDMFMEDWTLPDKWFIHKTGKVPINNFGPGHLWDCYFNMYTTGCWT